MISQAEPSPETTKPADAAPIEDRSVPPGMPPEYGGRGGLDPVRYGDWEKNGRCMDF